MKINVYIPHGTRRISQDRDDKITTTINNTPPRNVGHHTLTHTHKSHKHSYTLTQNARSVFGYAPAVCVCVCMACLLYRKWKRKWILHTRCTSCGRRLVCRPYSRVCDSPGTRASIIDLFAIRLDVALVFAPAIHIQHVKNRAKKCYIIFRARAIEMRCGRLQFVLVAARRCAAQNRDQTITRAAMFAVCDVCV